MKLSEVTRWFPLHRPGGKEYGKCMRDIPKKNCLVGGSMALFSAACFAGASFFYTKVSQGGLQALYLVLAMAQASFGALLIHKSRK